MVFCNIGTEKPPHWLCPFHKIVRLPPFVAHCVSYLPVYTIDDKVTWEKKPAQGLIVHVRPGGHFRDSKHFRREQNKGAVFTGGDIQMVLYGSMKTDVRKSRL